MNRTQRITGRILDAAARLPIYALVIAAAVLILATAHQTGATMTETPAPAATTPASIADEIAGLRLQIQQLLDSRICCTPCVAETTQGQRSGPNIANLINGGVGLCYDHANAITAAVTGRSPGGILLPGQN